MAFDLQSRRYVHDEKTRVWTREGFESIAYNDGDAIEQRIFESINRAGDVSVLSAELACAITDWPSLYHLSALRGNLLRPLRSLLRGRILEIGAGCGAITRFLGETGAEVLALEGSSVRARIAAGRCRDLGNVTVLADTFHAFAKEPAFDVVTLIGVLEYARKFFPGRDPIDAMLSHARGMLRPGGTLIVAIENQLGLKYFAGYPEDHLGVPAYGIEDQYRSDQVVTFGREELKRRITAAGLGHQKWWFPFPDYKLPVSILSERAADEATGLDMSPLLAGAASGDPQRPQTAFFALESAWKPVFRNQLAGHLANSFLLAASDERASTVEGEALAYHYSVKRRPAFAKQVAFIQQADKAIAVKQTLLYPEATLPDQLPLAIRLERQEYVQGRQWKQRLVDMLNTPGWSLSDIQEWSAVWFRFLLEKAGLAQAGNLTARQALPGLLIDLLPRNLILGDDGNCRLIDQEWEVKLPLELGYLLFRGILLELATVSSMAMPVAGTPLPLMDIFHKVTQGLGVPVTAQDLERYAALENDFQLWATGLNQSSMLPWLQRCRLPLRIPILTERQLVMQQRDMAMNERAQALAERDAALAELAALKSKAAGG